MNNLYLYKLKESITESDYDSFYQTIKDTKDKVSPPLNDYYIPAKHVLDLMNHVYELFKSSEVEEIRTCTIERVHKGRKHTPRGA